MRPIVRVGLALVLCAVFAAWNERAVQSTQATHLPHHRLPLASCALASCSRSGSVCASEMQASVMLWP